MRLTLRCFFVGLLTLSGGRAAGQADSLTAADTVQLTKRRLFLGVQRLYEYHYANNLADQQLMPLLRRSDDSTVRRYTKRWQRAHYTNIGLTASGYGLTLLGTFLPLRHPETNLALLSGGMGMFAGALIPLERRSRQLEQAVRAHNRAIRSRTGEYYAPPVHSSPAAGRLSLADTVGIRSAGGRRYGYRGLRVLPAYQLSRLADRLADNEVKSGLQYTRRVGMIGRLFTGFGTSFLVPQLLVYGIQRTNGRSTTVNSPILWTSLTAITIGYGIRFHGNRVQFRTVQLLNERLRSRYGRPAPGEHFPNP